MFDTLLEKFCIKNVFDVCAGTGCIGISLKKKYMNLNVTLLDVNPHAIDCINHNLYTHKLTCNVIHANAFDYEVRCDVVVCNPPYVRTDFVLQDQNQYIHKSLYGGCDGLYFCKKFLKNVSAKYVIFELGSMYQVDVFLIFCEKLKWKCVLKFKPYDNLHVCFVIIENSKYPLLDSNQHDS